MDGTPGTNQVAMVERWLLVCPCRRLSVCVSIGLSFHYIYLFIYLLIYSFTDRSKWKRHTSVRVLRVLRPTSPNFLPHHLNPTHDRI